MESCCIYLPKMSFILLVLTIAQLEGHDQSTPAVTYNSPPSYTDYGLNFQGGQMMPPKVSNYDKEQSQPKPKEDVRAYYIKIQTEPSAGSNIPNRYESQERHPSASFSQNLMAVQQVPNPTLNGIPMANSIDRQSKQVQQVNLRDYEYQDSDQQHYQVVNESPQPIIFGQPNVYPTQREAQEHPSHYQQDYTKHKYPQGYEIYDDNTSPKDITINLPPYGETATSQDYKHGHGEQVDLGQYHVVHEKPTAHVVAVPSSGDTTSVVYPAEGYQNVYPYSPAGVYGNSGSRQPYIQAQNKVYNPYGPSYIQSTH